MKKKSHLDSVFRQRWYSQTVEKFRLRNNLESDKPGFRSRLCRRMFLVKS